MKRFTWNFNHFSLDLEGLFDHPEAPPTNQSQAGLFTEKNSVLREKFQSGAIGFYDLPEKFKAKELAELKQISDPVRKEFDSAVIMGIGGSYLGPAAIFSVLRTPPMEREFPVAWLSNVDNAAVRRTEDWINGKNPATVVISKSGNTTETLAAFFHLSGQLKPKGYVVITDPSTGELRHLVKEKGWSSLPVPPNVGGRFSVLSSVGIFPAMLAGLPVEELLDGARQMRAQLEKFTPFENPAYLFAYAKTKWDQIGQRGIQYFMPYDSRFKLFSDWYVQLWGESLGKKTIGKKTSVGPTPVAALGTTDQHSILQLLKEGPRNKIIGFMDVWDSENSGTKIGTPPFTPRSQGYLLDHTFDQINHFASLATQKSLQNSGMPTYRIELKKANAHALGALFFFFETACAFAGELYEVNAFDQPGVEESKQLLREML